MRTNSFPVAPRPLALRRIVDSFDAKSRREGLHVTQSWDFKAHRFANEITPVQLVDYCARLAKRAMDDRKAVAILLDQYFFTVLSLLAVRAWDEGDPNENLDRVSTLVRAVQGPDGSEMPFVDDAETLLFLAVSYYHPEESSYDMLLAKVRALDERHQLRLAIPSLAMLGAHLRWGLRFMYRRDAGVMRDDNVADYPWLVFAEHTIAREYWRLSDAASEAAACETLAESLLDGLSADPWAFTNALPAALAGDPKRYDEFREQLRLRGAELLDAFTMLQPSPRSYSPLSYACNFPSNAAVATVAVALEDGRTGPSMNALFCRERQDGAVASFAERLMQYSASVPGRLGAGGAPLIVHDPADGAHAYNAVVRTLREFLADK